MKIFTVEYDDFYIGFADWIHPSDQVIKYAMEIHILFLGSKPFYIFFKGTSFVLSHDNVDDAMIQLEAAGVYSRLSFPTNVGPMYSAFTFDENDESFGIEASLKKKMTNKTKEDLESRLPMYSMMRIMMEFDVLKTKSA